MRATREPYRARSIRRSRLLGAAVTVALAAGGSWQGPAHAATAGGVDRASAVRAGAPPQLHSVRHSPATPALTATRPRPVAPHVQKLPFTQVDRGGRAPVSSDRAAKASHPDALVAQLRAPVDEGSSLVGVTWTRDAAAADLNLRLRTRDAAGWTSWRDLDFDPDEGPAPGEEGDTRDGTSPVWIGDAKTVEVAAYSPTRAPDDLRLEAIDPGTSPYDEAATARATESPTTSTEQTLTTSSADGTFPSIPDVVTRAQWGADERLGDMCWAPRLGTTFKMVFVHHTVNSNDYSRAESAAIVRGIYAYHTQSRGWCDIGYNFLVDRYGIVYEGRAGGIRRPVRGAHAGDYNVNTTGISLIGNFETARPTAAMKTGLVNLIAWRMGTAYHGAYGHASVYGKRFARISGHRDAMSTACPGQAVYDWLPRLRERVAQRLGGYRSRVETLWLSLGGPNGSFGPVRRGEQIENGGQHTTFQHGRIYSSRAGQFAFKPGPILTRYVHTGETDQELRYPASRVRTPANGLAADFQGGSMFWSRATGAVRLLNGPVLRRYVEERAALSRLGFPTTGLRETKSSVYANFEHGTITYYPATKRVRVTYE